MTNKKLIAFLCGIWILLLLLSCAIEINIPYITPFLVATLPPSITLNWLNWSNLIELTLVTILSICFVTSKEKYRITGLVILQALLLLHTFWLLPLLNNKIATLLQTNEEVIAGLYFLNLSFLFLKLLLIIRLRLIYDYKPFEIEKQ